MLIPTDMLNAAECQSRLAFGLALAEMAKIDNSIVAIAADSVDLMGLRSFQNLFPERFFDVGIAEQNAMGIASGLATTGLKPFVCGYAPFITARSMEQLRNDVAYANQRVVIGGAASGISLGVSGGTHHALEDIAIMRTLPNMTAIVPADVEQSWEAVWATQGIRGPVYIRLGGRIPEPHIKKTKSPFRVGKADCLREGSDLTIIACGVLVHESLVAADTLKSEGLSIRVLNMHTIKPLDDEAIILAALETKGIVTAEEHRVTGGLGGAVAELLARERPLPMRMVGMCDEFAVVGPTSEVRAAYGMTAQNIVSACKELLA